MDKIKLEQDVAPIVKKIVEEMKLQVQEMNSQTVLKTLEIRLQGIREVTKRVRFSFIVLIIASCAVFIAMWNGHFSWNRKSAFPADMSFCLDKGINYNPQELKQCLEKEKSEATDEHTINKIDKLLNDKRLGVKNFPLTNEDNNVLSLDEYNRRNLAMEWLKSTNISIGLLGVIVNMNDLSLLGSCALMIISFWFVFNIRRENRAIVGLLRDVKNITDLENLPKNNLRNDNMLIASMAFQEIAHSLTFVSIAKDSPLGAESIFPTDSVKEDSKTDRFVRLTIVTFRLVGMFLLLFLPAIVILVTIITDLLSMGMNTAFSENFPIINDSITTHFKDVFNLEMIVAMICFVITFLMCIITSIFQSRTTDALYVFAEKLGSLELEKGFLDSFISLRIKQGK
jgi:hypothetical protein